MAWRVECLRVMAIVASTAPCTADWTVNAQGSLFYTDDVGLFSATRRLRSPWKIPPTQPAIDSADGKRIRHGLRAGCERHRYRIADRLALLVGFQRAHRRRSFEEEIVRNTNVSVGASYTFLAKTAYPRLPMDFFDNERGE